ncbi:MULTISPECIES: prepilin-type N-terminal cleavage/methylation domain-containing protein [Cyanophyceae]|uniref:prepilin-type N-terminal cleavage/methylation domain-containing protein n=1 Tax=Cyanophyceae TaxID=3028117 RepID=UPI0016886FA5|nr:MULTISPECIES: prepilin-type N-terminal cleavage/methylation domain-containing protein [unclassified Phormidium]MBD1916890.1 type II secretion system protein [Phormidium sp. FACHB-77]MBD2029896.1 type II secretion system protein [Phormidium sp. FACHB-322]MBD2053092.1 type II secretion system protein [Leptolyngbya sp. FACHB-60]
MITNRLKRHLYWAGGRSPAQGQQGLTLIECLVAIMIVGLVSSAIAPALVISVATRVQSQKAEQALELAQSEIDRVRLLVERSEANTDNLPPSTAIAGANPDSRVAEVAGPTYGAPVAAPTTAFQTRAASLNGNQFAVQVYRTPGRFVGSVPVTFGMGVRVYDSEAVQTGNGNLSKDPATLRMVNGTGQRGHRPLVALYTNVTAGDSRSSLCQYIQHLNAAASVPTGCN